MRIPDFDGFVNEAKDIPDRDAPVSIGGLLVNYQAKGPWDSIKELRTNWGITTLREVYAMFALPCPTKPGGVRDLAKWVEDNPRKLNAVFARLYRGGADTARVGKNYKPDSYKPASYKLDEGISATLYVNDDKRTVDTVEYTFDGSTLAEVKKELAAMAKALKKEDKTWWYQGSFKIGGKSYYIEGTEIGEE